jgi:hypothetical protein
MDLFFVTDAWDFDQAGGLTNVRIGNRHLLSRVY